MNTKIDILLATYNGEDYLEEQINSILNQTNKGWRLLIHDDGSTDNTIEIIKEYHKLYPKKIIYIEDNVKTGGAKYNFAHLMGLSNAEYIMFCDQDDVWYSDKVEITYKRMVELEKLYPNTPILVHTDLTVVDRELKIIASSMIEYQKLPYQINDLLSRLVINNITGCTVMINRKAKEVSLPIHKDAIMHDWWIGCRVAQYKGIIYLIEKSTVLYRQHGKNSIGANEYSTFKEIKKILTGKNIINAIKRIQQYRKVAKALGVKVSYVRIAKKLIMISIRRTQ